MHDDDPGEDDPSPRDPIDAVHDAMLSMGARDGRPIQVTLLIAQATIGGFTAEQVHAALRYWQGRGDLALQADGAYATLSTARLTAEAAGRLA